MSTHALYGHWQAFKLIVFLLWISHLLQFHGINGWKQTQKASSTSEKSPLVHTNWIFAMPLSTKLCRTRIKRLFRAHFQTSLYVWRNAQRNQLHRRSSHNYKHSCGTRRSISGFIHIAHSAANAKAPILHLALPCCWRACRSPASTPSSSQAWPSFSARCVLLFFLFSVLKQH